VNPVPELDMSQYDSEDNAELVYGLIQGGGLWLALHNAADRFDSAIEFLTQEGATSYARILREASQSVFGDAAVPPTISERRNILDAVDETVEDRLEELTESLYELPDPL